MFLALDRSGAFVLGKNLNFPNVIVKKASQIWMILSGLSICLQSLGGYLSGCAVYPTMGGGGWGLFTEEGVGQ